MAMGKSFRLYEKNKPPNPHSIILEHRNFTETLLFESQVVAALSKCFTIIFSDSEQYLLCLYKILTRRAYNLWIMGFVET